MAHSEKKQWVKPEVRRFASPEELLAHFQKELPEGDQQTLMKAAEQLQRSAKRSDASSPPHKSGRG